MDYLHEHPIHCTPWRAFSFSSLLLLCLLMVQTKIFSYPAKYFSVNACCVLNLFSDYYIVAADNGESLISGDPGPAPSRPPLSSRGAAAAFSDKMVEVYQSPLLLSSTPHTLPHHFLTYNMVGVVRSHSDDDTPMIEVGITMVMIVIGFEWVWSFCRWSFITLLCITRSAFLITTATAWPR